MKKAVVTILLIVIAFSSVKAQRPNLQMRGFIGLNVYSAHFKNEAFFPGGVSVGYLGGFGLRVTRKRLMGEIDFSFIRSGIPVDLNGVGQDIERSTIRVSAFELPFIVGYKFVKTAFFKWNVNAGISTIIITKVQANDFGIKANDLKNPQFGLRAGTGIDFAFFTFDLNYTYSLNKLVKEISRNNSHLFEFNIGVIF
ncbi:MAG: outer membrane beta-barrel protein [Chitinophagales bacterium]